MFHARENDLMDSLLSKTKISIRFSFYYISFLRGTLSYSQGFCNYTVLPYKTRMNSLYN